jgi:hypothetical protein
MKRNLLSFFSLLVFAGTSAAQCDPTAHDWGTSTFGVSPDPLLGETFSTGSIGVPYSDVVYVKTPSNAGDINPDLGTLIQIDSIRLDSITIFNGLNDVQLSTIGLDVACNNNGDSQDPCMFMPSNEYCGGISGTPTVAGTFDVKIFVTIYFEAFGPQQLPYFFEGYTLQIDGTVGVDDKTLAKFDVSQNAPNPALDHTIVQYELEQYGDVNFTVMNLVGHVVLNKTVRSKKGDNQMRIDTSLLQSGIYLYSVQSGDKKITRKMIVQH